MESVMEHVSPFGKYQKCVLFLIGLSSILCAMTIYSTIFTTASPELVCYRRINETLSTVAEDACEVLENDSYECYFDRKYYGNTLITEFKLICNKKFYGSLTQTFYMLGTLSSLFIGYFSDKFGRRKLSLVLTAVIFIIYFISELIQLRYFNLSIQVRYICYSISQFLIGTFVNGLYVVLYVLLIELTTSKYKTKATNTNLYLYISGEILVLGIAYFTRDWHIMNWFITLYALFIVILLYFFLPESPRFLVQKKRLKEAKELIHKIAKFNGKFDVDTIENEVVGLISQDSISNGLNNTHEDKVFSTIFKSKSIITRALLLSYVWFAISLVYYGVSLGITSIKNMNPYMNYFFSSGAEFVGCVFCYFNDCFKRKNVFIVFLSIATVSCLLVALISQENLIPNSETFNWRPIVIILLTSIGKAMVSAASACAYIYTSAMFPTKIRNTLFLIVSSIGKIGSIISPLINILGEMVWKPLPFIIFGSGSFIGCLFIVILPDPDLLNNL